MRRAAAVGQSLFSQRPQPEPVQHPHVLVAGQVPVTLKSMQVVARLTSASGNVPLVASQVPVQQPVVARCRPEPLGNAPMVSPSMPAQTTPQQAIPARRMPVAAPRSPTNTGTLSSNRLSSPTKKEASAGAPPPSSSHIRGRGAGNPLSSDQTRTPRLSSGKLSSSSPRLPSAILRRSASAGCSSKSSDASRSPKKSVGGTTPTQKNRHLSTPTSGSSVSPQTNSLRRMKQNSARQQEGSGMGSPSKREHRRSTSLLQAAGVPQPWQRQQKKKTSDMPQGTPPHKVLAETGCTGDGESEQDEWLGEGASMTVATVDAALEKSQQLIKELAILTQGQEDPPTIVDDWQSSSECFTPTKRCHSVSDCLRGTSTMSSSTSFPEDQSTGAVATEMAAIWKRLRGLEARLERAEGEVVVDGLASSNPSLWGVAWEARDDGEAERRCESHADYLWDNTCNPDSQGSQNACGNASMAVSSQARVSGIVPSSAILSHEGIASYASASSLPSIAECARMAVVRSNSRRPSLTIAPECQQSGVIAVPPQSPKSVHSPTANFSPTATLHSSPAALHLAQAGIPPTGQPTSPTGVSNQWPPATPNGVSGPWQSVMVTQVHKYMAWVKSPETASGCSSHGSALDS